MHYSYSQIHIAIEKIEVVVLVHMINFCEIHHETNFRTFCFLITGKSSIIQALFRIVETTMDQGDVSNNNNAGGSIMISGVDTRLVPLSQLRRSLSIIPQDPVLMQGTIR